MEMSGGSGRHAVLSVQGWGGSAMSALLQVSLAPYLQFWKIGDLLVDLVQRSM